MSDVIVSCKNLKKTYHDGQTSLQVLQGIDMEISAGSRIAIVGPSGSGKSSLLQLLGGLDTPTDGKVLIRGIDWQHLSERKRCQVRNQTLGFIYQFHHLLPEFSALENVVMPMLLSSLSTAESMSRAEDILTRIGLKDRLHHKPGQLSGGERQRVAIARALVHNPACVFADEPTGNLDQSTAQKVFDVMLSLNRDYQTALVMVTHDLRLASRMDVIMSLQDGLLKPKIVSTSNTSTI